MTVNEAARIAELEQGLRTTSEALKTYEALTADLRSQLSSTLLLLDRVTAVVDEFAVGLSD